MTRRIGYKPLMAAALAGAMALSAGPAMAQPRDHRGGGGRGPEHGWQGGGRGHGGYDRGGYNRGYQGGYGRRDNSGAVIGGALLGLGILGGALALQQSQVAPPPAYYAPPPDYYAPPPAYAPPPGYYGYK
jgi:hypothetical protein